MVTLHLVVPEVLAPIFGIVGTVMLIVSIKRYILV